jgi:tripartite-type tricarboxylate transporter receptor subunit TctC
VGSFKRSAALPGVPTTIEAGFPDSEYNFWIGMFVPVKTPGAVIARLHQESVKALDVPAVRERIAKLGAETMTMAPGRFDAFVRDELATNAVLVKAAGIAAN